jgi:hypothetical protein
MQWSAPMTILRPDGLKEVERFIRQSVAGPNVG